jgi:DNA repair exonuclease SbcCD ATPase subunit
MRLEALSVRNFRRIRQANLTALPAEGLIVVAGPNESGKTSLAEAIGFALYGRSVRGGVSVVDLIRWGEDRLEVELVFRVNAQRFQVRRELDCLGSHLVTLRELDGEDACVAGPDAVRRRLRELGLIDFDVFRHLLFMSEPISEPGLRKVLVDEVTGITMLARAAEQVRDEIKGREREFSLLVGAVERKTQQADRLRTALEGTDALEADAERARDEFQKAQEVSSRANALWRGRRRLADRWHRQGNRLGNIAATDRDAVRAAVEKAEGLLSKEAEDQVCPQDGEPATNVVKETAALRAFLTSHDAALSDAEERSAKQRHLLETQRAAAEALRVRVRKHTRQKRLAVAATFLCALIACGAGTVLWHLSETAGGELFTSLAIKNPRVIAALSAGAAALLAGVVAFFTFLTRAMLLDRIRREDRNARATVREIEASVTELERVLAAGQDPARWAEVPGSAPGEDPRRTFEALVRDTKNLAQNRRDLAAEADAAYRTAQEALRKARSQRDRLEGDLKEKQNSAAKLEELGEETRRLEAEKHALETALDVHLTALELLESATAAVRLRALPALGETLRLVIGPLTGGAYREVRLAGDLTAEVFASPKGDFLAPAELSGAVRAAVELAIGAAMASLLAQGRRPDGHFLLADHAFSPFDPTRLQQVLDGLRRLPGLPQIVAFLNEIPGALAAEQVWRIEDGEARRADRESTDTPFGFPETEE